jgi:hypothetical protein
VNSPKPEDVARVGRGGTIAERGNEWHCPTCSAANRTPFCASCGEKRPSARDLHFRELAAHALDSFASLDGRFFRTVRALLARPGELTVAYLEGRRKPFVGPIQLFLVANVVFFAAQWLTGLSLFFTPLANQMNAGPHSELATKLVNERIAARGMTLDAYMPLFDRAGLTKTKSLVVLMVPMFAAAVALVMRKQWRTFVPPLVFALHFFAFQMIAFSILFVVATLTMAIAWRGDWTSHWHAFDTVFSWIEVLALAGYLWFALGRCAPSGGKLRLARVLLLAASTPVVLYLYRFIIFLITLYTT